MQTLRVKILASTNGEPYRTIGDGTWNADGNANFLTADQAIPLELLQWFSQLQATSDPLFGTWNHDIGTTRYEVEFTPL